MTDRQFQDLRKLVYERSGIHFPDGKKYVMESRLTHRLTELELENFDQYLQFLTTGPYQQPEFQELFNRITINETSFYRNEPQLDWFEKSVLPGLLEARRTTRRLRIWSAPCSTGEEPYTIATIVHRALGPRLSDWRVEILGTDISERCIEAAGQARYTEYAMRTVPDHVRARYFRQDGPYFTIDPAIKSMVTFQKHNLKDRLAARRLGAWDVIFCRNVLIYFDDPMKKHVLETFAEVLADDGTLLLGHSESVRPGEAPFASMNVPQGFAYRKVKPGSGVARAA